MPALTVLLAALGWAAILAALLHSVAKSTAHWLVACLICSGLYVATALRLEQLPTQPLLLDALRWGLLAVALFSFVRYRRSRRQG